MADKRHSSVAARMPRLRMEERLCSRFITEKLPSIHIFRFFIISQYSAVPTRSPLGRESNLAAQDIEIRIWLESWKIESQG